MKPKNKLTFASDFSCKKASGLTGIINNYEKCIVYQRYKVLEKNPVLTGLQRFQLRYKEFDYGRMLGI